MAVKIAEFHPVLPFVAWAELLTWTHVRDWDARNRALLSQWMSDLPMLPGEKKVAEICGVLAAGAQLRGQPRSENDMWIAACCLAYDLPLATLNVKDFEYFRIHHGLTIVTA